MAYGAWADVPLGEQNLLEDYRNQWEQLVGYTIDVNDTELLAMANRGVVSLSDFGQYVGTQTNLDAMPWARYGLDKNQWHTLAETYQDIYKDLTGVQADWPIKGGILDQAFSENLSSGEFRNRILSDTNLLKTYGWLKYGLDYQTFQQQKVQMRGKFGHDLSDAEATQQLGYLHTAGGSNVSVSAQPTFSQQEKRQAQVGVAESATR